MATARTQTVELELVGLDSEPIPAGDFLLEAFDVAVLEFHDLPAGRADQVVMVALVGYVVVLGLGSEVTRLG